MAKQRIDLLGGGEERRGGGGHELMVFY